MSTVIINGFTVLDRLMLISGLSKDTAAPYLSSCTYELARIMARLRDGINAEDFADGIINAAAAQVNCSATAAMMLKSEGDFSVGDISVKYGNETKIAAAEKLRCDAFAAIAHILTDEGFAFVGMRS